MNFDVNEVTHLLLENLKMRFSPPVYQLWFSELTVRSLTQYSIELVTSGDFKRDTLTTRYMEILKVAVSEILGFEVDIIILTLNDLDEELILKQMEENKPSAADDKAMEIGMKIEGQSIVEEYTFENFIVGESNKFAHAACFAVAKGKSHELYNPLFIYGPSGIGKTHLLFAITNEIKRSSPSVKIVYKRCEEFTNEMIAALKNGKMERFRAKFRTPDVLLIDDIQFIADKMAIQEEFFYTFNELYENNKQIILTSDCPPKDISPLDERLCTRFEWGIIADIQPPSEELRTAIIRKKAESLGITIPEDALSFLSNSLQKNIRQIEGAIKKIHVISNLASVPITLDLCRRAIADIINGVEPSPVTVDRVIKIVAEYYGVTAEDIRGQKRNAGIAMARHMCIYLIRKNTSLSLEEIGEKFGRNHATVISSLRKIEDEKESIPSTAALIEELMTKIKSF
ncbi:MAG: chromosomal replication initiator protein DnaA [Clostridia bacterium]|nr:chromosomal replication initiator protein DnaA [Clostridia bacterium]